MADKVSGKKRCRSEDDSAAEPSSKASGSSSAAFTVYMEGLPYTATEQDIAKFLQGAVSAGDVKEVRAPTFHDSGRLRGYAHVDLVSKKAVDAALTLDGKYLGGRFINVSHAKPVGAGAASLAFSSKPRPAGCTTLFVKGLPYETTEEAVAADFSKFGAVASVRLARWNHTERFKGFGYVQFEHGFSAEAAMKAFRSAAEGTPGAAPVQVGGRTVSLDYETGIPRQSFKASSGQKFYKTEEAEKVKKTAAKLKKTAEKEKEGEEGKQKEKKEKKRGASTEEDSEDDARKDRKRSSSSKGKEERKRSSSKGRKAAAGGAGAESGSDAEEDVPAPRASKGKGKAAKPLKKQRRERPADSDAEEDSD